MVDRVQTLFGTFDEKQLKSLKGYIDELMHCMAQIKSSRTSMGEIIDLASDELKIPKKIVRKMAKVQFNQSMPTDLAEFKELEALIEGITEVK